MKQIILTFFAFAIGMVTVFAQKTKTQFSMSTRGIQVVVLDLTGNTSIEVSPKDEIKIKSFLQLKGGTWGWEWPDQRPEFKIKERVSKDTLYITSPPTYSPKIIGITTYSENIDNTIMMPEGKKIYVIHSDQLQVEDCMEMLDVKNTGDLTVTILKSTVKQLKCHARRILKINTVEASKSYELNGFGTQIYYLEADQITINLK
jgi:hypothetical protein